MDTVTISAAEYARLIKYQNKLHALEVGGVKDWALYDISLDAEIFDVDGEMRSFYSIYIHE